MQPQNSYTPGPLPTNLPPGYEFMANSPSPKKSMGVPNSPLIRVAVVLVGLLVLIVLFSIVKGILSGGSNRPQLLSVAQDQQEIIHIVTAAQMEKSLSVTNRNTAITAQLGVTSGQSQLIQYMSKAGFKVKPKELSLKLSALTDKKLATASINSAYDSTFQSVMETELATYQQDIQAAYGKTKGKYGQTILKNQYDGSKLLLEQLHTQ
jgi:hypothetical protein